MSDYYLELETKFKKLWQFVKDMDKELAQNQQWIDEVENAKDRRDKDDETESN